MKKTIIAAVCILTSLTSYEQILLEDKTGDVIVRNQFRADASVGLIKLNTGDQSIGFNYIKSNKSADPNSYIIQEFGIKAKPTEGYAAVITNNQFSPGVKISYALTKLRIFSKDTKSPFIDWGSAEINYDINKYSFFSSDSTFSKQFYSKTFKPLSLLLHYNYLTQTGNLAGRLLISIKAGYSRRSNFEDLRSVEIQDIKTIVDPTTSTARQIINKKTAKQGMYEELDAYPMTLSLTFLTRTDPLTIADPAKLGGTIPNPDLKRLRLGFNAYLKNIASNVHKPNTKAGVIFFLTRQQENGIRIPVFGLNIQADDPFDLQNTNTGLQSRITIGFTSIFSL